MSSSEYVDARQVSSPAVPAEPEPTARPPDEILARARGLDLGDPVDLDDDPVEPPRAPEHRVLGDPVLYYTEDGMPICRAHVVECAKYKFCGRALRVRPQSVRERTRGTTAFFNAIAVQRAIRRLAEEAVDSALQIEADGVVGPATRRAVALVNAFGGAPGDGDRITDRTLRALGIEPPVECAMCCAVYAEGNVCYRDRCAAPLHPQWPAVYCSNDCALEDL